MMTPRKVSEDRGSPQHFRHTPLQVIHIVGNFLRIWSIYSLYRYLSQTGASVVLFLFICLIPASILFLILQKPWKGRPLSNTQSYNGRVFWCYPWSTLCSIIWAEGSRLEKDGCFFIFYQIGGLIAMVASFYFLSQGWATETYSPFSFKDNVDAEVQPEQVLGMKEMAIPIFAGILSALRRVIARRVSLKNQLKRRLHALTIASATCFMFPIAMWDVIIGSASSSSNKMPFSTWAFLSTILFGVILIFYVDSIAEERLHMVFSSPKHLMVAGGCIIVMEKVYKLDFSLPGFLICCIVLGFGIYEATSLERGRKDSFQKPDSSDGILGDEIQMSALPT
ncbi:uncharacterized protein LOC112181513 isoform X3 [Rosa chinensis]|uniref:uncharacterized protein LOC112181513 isoform X3 n=1 Tax=Rosa chinensis TaxID=74649 RepID=UPI000D08C79C|nr:uncharacterized protein LOC112181513 isoform X3 [Rosa chinensis]